MSDPANTHRPSTEPRLRRPGHVALALELFRRAFWLPTLVLAVHGALALVEGYDRFIPLDVLMHLAGGMAVAWCFARALDVLVGHGFVRLPERPVWDVLVIALTATAAVVWEFAEWSSDFFVGTRSQRGLDDTMLDMLLGVVGGLVFLAARRLRRRG